MCSYIYIYIDTVLYIYIYYYNDIVIYNVICILYIHICFIQYSHCNACERTAGAFCNESLGPGAPGLETDVPQLTGECHIHESC